MTNFEFFREKCKTANRFACHIFFKNHILEIIENDLQKLNSIEEEQVFYFEGVWEEWENLYFVRIFTFSESQDIDELGGDIIPRLSSFRAFDIIILYRLYKMGIEIRVIEQLIPQLFEEYDRQEKEAPKLAYSMFLEHWEKVIKDWRKSYNENINEK